MIALSYPDEPEIQPDPWCFSWWHKTFWGEERRVVHENRNIQVIEYYCKKCGLKTDGFTHFGPIEIVATRRT